MAVFRRKLHKIVLLHVLEQFLNHLRTIGPVGNHHEFLLAVSGGVDSMVMLDLFSRSELSFAVAHCNFQLRPAEADAEEALVRKVCVDKGLRLFTARFDTTAFEHLKKLSTQEAARRLRYDFFDQLAKDHGFHWIATAHHRNDSFETVLLNLVRGTGIDGLTGIPVINGKIIRPLLFADREMINDYARQYEVEWREDSSNQSDDYSRNLIRNKVIPLLKEINPSLEDTFELSVKRLASARRLMQEVITHISSDACIKTNKRATIRKSAILNSVSPALVLWEIIKDSGITFEQCMSIVNTEHSGKWFSSKSHRLLVDRESYILEKIRVSISGSCQIESDDDQAVLDEHVLLLEQSKNENIAFARNDDTVAFMDIDKLTFPLVWRCWRDGDHFIPLGMKQQKKVSDFLIDKKVDRLAKQEVTVLESAGEIVWVVGHRISENVKVTESSKGVMIIRLQRDEGHSG
jgi:tRNA(Ile)-lysidine synthase